ncbi:hypothetical protein ACOMDM_13690 [Serratia plymuthica]|uniref:hypothetical protein n=1 Tax=Serratia plymuthica TaxID=82996 RepID=UPI003B9FB2E5
MNNKLSELSKPVAYKFDHGVMGPGDFKYGTPQMHSTGEDENASPLYSQEYVSALRADVAKWFEVFKKAVSVGARYEERMAEMDADLADKNGVILEQSKRIAELENDLGLKHIRAVEEALIFATDRNSELEAKLATPVRLPQKNTGWDRDDGEDCWNNAIDACAKELRAAGFTVEGDEQ